MTKKILVTLLTFTMISTLLWGCGDTTDHTNDTVDETSGLTKVVLNEVAHTVFYAPLYVAIEEGYFEDEGIDLELVTGFGADKTMTALITGGADIGLMGPETSIYTSQQGSKDVVVNFAQLTQRAGNFLVAREEMPNFKWSDLIGTDVIAGRSGGMPQMVFEYVLKENGIDPFKDLHMEQGIDFGSTAAAFSGGQGDFTIEFEPAASALEMDDEGYVVASLGVDSGYVPYTAFSTTTSYMEKNPEIIQSFTNALQRGTNACQDMTATEIAEIISPQFADLDIESLSTIITRYAEQDTWRDSLVFEENSFELIQDILQTAGELQEPADYKQLVNTEFAKTALEQVK